MLRVDHVAIAVDDLGAAARSFEDTYGLVSTAGGEHPALGTSNRIIPLGGPYLELLAGWPAPEGFLGWMLRTDDIDAEAARLGLDVAPLTRRRPDGVELRWRLAGPGFGAALPTFIQWDIAESDHPGVGGTNRLARVEVAVDRGELAEWLGGALASLPVDVVAGDPPGVRGVVLRSGVRVAPPFGG